MLPIIVSILVGLIVGGGVFVLLGAGWWGLGIGTVIAVLTYWGVSLVLSRPRMLSGVDIDRVPDGERAADAIDHAHSMISSIARASQQITDANVRHEADDFLAATESLIQYVNTDPHVYAILNRFISVYGEQTQHLLDGYADVQSSGMNSQGSRIQVMSALQALETAAAGELKRAVISKQLALESDSEAIVRLAHMDGYEPARDDEHKEPES